MAIVTYWVTMLFDKPGHQSWYSTLFTIYLCRVSNPRQKNPSACSWCKKHRKAHTAYESNKLIQLNCKFNYLGLKVVA